MSELIQSIVALGGFGYLNYELYSRLDDVDFGSSTDRKFFILMMSSMNYLIYLIYSIFMEEFVLSIIVTILTSFALTIIFPYLIKLFYKFINRIRGEKNLASQENRKIHDIVFGVNESRRLFVFSIPENMLITSGYSGSNNGENEDFSLIVYPLYGTDETRSFTTEKEILDYVENKKLEASIYLNFEKKVKVIYF